VCAIVSNAEERKKVRTLNEAFSTLSMRRRYEVWFLRVGLANGSGAWWFRYLLTNPGARRMQWIIADNARPSVGNVVSAREQAAKLDTRISFAGS
jgi:hypothetical protein